MDTIRFEYIEYGGQRICCVDSPTLWTYSAFMSSDLKMGKADITVQCPVRGSVTIVARDYTKLAEILRPVMSLDEYNSMFIDTGGRIDLTSVENICTITEIDYVHHDSKIDIFWNRMNSCFVRDYAKLRDLIDKYRRPSINIEYGKRIAELEADKIADAKKIKELEDIIAKLRSNKTAAKLAEMSDSINVIREIVSKPDSLRIALVKLLE